MSRLALFAISLVVLVAIGSQPRHIGGQLKDMCVCVPARAGLMVKSAIARTQARSAERIRSTARVGQ